MRLIQGVAAVRTGVPKKDCVQNPIYSLVNSPAPGTP